jgi:hypothetical protein
MIIEEITETNYEDKIKEGDHRVDIKLEKFERQGEDIDWFKLFDPTIWAYKILKDKQNKPLKLRGYQDKIINDKHRFVVVAAANQIGKTWALGCVKAIHHAIHVNNASVLVVSKSEPQAIMILDEIKWMMKRAHIKFDSIIGEVENRTELHIKSPDGIGTSVIRCLPTTTGVLSYLATLIICDEIGFWEIENMKQTEYFNRVIVSRTNETKNWKNDHFTMGQIVCISNPNAQQGVLWSLWNDPDYNQYRYCWLANPSNSLEEYNSWKRKLPTDEFDSVYAATFSSASGGFITTEEYNDAIKEQYSVFPPPNQSICLGGDFAGEDTVSRDVDETILFGGMRIREGKLDKVKIIYYKQFPLRTKKENVYNEIKSLTNVSHFAYDKAGVGDSVKNDLIDKHILSEYQIESLTYSLPNKSEVYYNMKHLFEQRRLMIPDLPKLKEQLMGLRFEKTEGGYIKVHHAREGLHDDWADALANCCWATLRSSGIPVEATFVEPQVKIEKKEKTLRYCERCQDYHWGKCELTTI